MRALLILAAGFLLGVIFLLLFWPQPPRSEAVPQHADIRATISDSYITRVAANQVHTLGPADISQLRIVSAPPAEMVANASLALGPFSVPAAIQLQPIAQNGSIQVRLITVRVAGIPIPGQLAGLLAGSINNALRPLLGHTARVVAVRVVPSGLQVFADYR